MTWLLWRGCYDDWTWLLWRGCYDDWTGFIGKSWVYDERWWLVTLENGLNIQRTIQLLRSPDRQHHRTHSARRKAKKMVATQNGMLIISDHHTGVRLFTPDFLPPTFYTPIFYPFDFLPPTTFYPLRLFTPIYNLQVRLWYEYHFAQRYKINHYISNYQFVNEKLKVVVSYATQSSVCICWRYLRDEPKDTVISPPFLCRWLEYCSSLDLAYGLSCWVVPADSSGYLGGSRWTDTGSW